MASTYEIRTARKQHQCTEASWHTIAPGDRYLYGSLPPWHECVREKKWHVMRACLRCAEQHGLHTNETRKSVEVIHESR